MKRIIKNISKSFTYSKSSWNNLKNTRYKSNSDHKCFVITDGDLDIKYTQNVNIITKEYLNRHIDNVKQELTYPLCQNDEKAFNFFIDQDRQK